MSENHANEAAFPVSTVDGFTNEGMTLRDYFAGQIIAAIVSVGGEEVIRDIMDGTRAGGPMANGAYVLADAMLKRRET